MEVVTARASAVRKISAVQEFFVNLLKRTVADIAVTLDGFAVWLQNAAKVG
jgi:hypothetical protein